jgi:hypothetical protein
MARLRFVDHFDSDDPGLSLDSIDEVFPSGSSVNHTLTDYYRGGSYVPANESTLIPTSGVIKILDFQGSGEGGPINVPKPWYGAILTGGQSSKTHSFAPPAHLAGKHFGCVIVGAGGGAGGSPGAGGGGGSVVYIPKGIPFHAGDEWQFRMGRGGGGGSTSDGGDGGTTFFSIKKSGWSSYYDYIAAGGGSGGETGQASVGFGATNADGGDRGRPWFWHADKDTNNLPAYSARQQIDQGSYSDTGSYSNPIFNPLGYPRSDGPADSNTTGNNIQASYGGEGGDVSITTGLAYGGGGGGVGGFDFVYGAWDSSTTNIMPRGGNGGYGYGVSSVLAAGGGGGRGPVVAATSTQGTNFQRNSGGGIFDSSYDINSKYEIQFFPTPKTGFHDAQGLSVLDTVGGSYPPPTTGNTAPQTNIFVGNSSSKNERSFYFKPTNTNRSDTSKSGGHVSSSSNGGYGVYGGKNGNTIATRHTSDVSNPFGTSYDETTGRIYRPKNWGGGGGAASRFTSTVSGGSYGNLNGNHGYGVSGGPGIVIIFGPTPSLDSDFLTTEGGEFIIPHIFPSADGFYNDSWS